MEVAAMYNQNERMMIQYNDHARCMNAKTIQIPEEVIQIEWVSLA